MFSYRKSVWPTNVCASTFYFSFVCVCQYMTSTYCKEYWFPLEGLILYIYKKAAFIIEINWSTKRAPIEKVLFFILFVKERKKVVAWQEVESKHKEEKKGSNQTHNTQKREEKKFTENKINVMIVCRCDALYIWTQKKIGEIQTSQLNQISWVDFIRPVQSTLFFLFSCFVFFIYLAIKVWMKIYFLYVSVDWLYFVITVLYFSASHATSKERIFQLFGFWTERKCEHTHHRSELEKKKYPVTEE